MFHLLVLLTCVLSSLVAGETTQVVQCRNHAGDIPLNTYIAGCIHPPCNLPQLQDALINIVFRAPRFLRSMRTLATAYVHLGLITLPVPYDLGEAAATCNFLANTYCPILEDEVVLYTLKMYIEPSFTVGTLVTIEFRVVDERNQPVLCVRAGLRIVEPLNTYNSTLALEDLQV